jgi:hypothetical protein
MSIASFIATVTISIKTDRHYDDDGLCEAQCCHDLKSVVIGN